MKSVCVGAGLVALDAVLNGKPTTPPRFYAGGSCGNVLAILSYLGWDAYPVARLANNMATKEIISDLRRWGVKTQLLFSNEHGSTPIVIHRIFRDKMDRPVHRFEFRDPDSGNWLPRFKPVLNSEVPKIIEAQPHSNIFYFDRVSRGIIELAKHNKENGALLFFEPSSIGDQRLFKECLEIVDVIKFSNQRIRNYAEIFPEQQVPLEIETLAEKGLRYRFSPNKDETEWKTLNPFPVSQLADSAGAGDWCSAGIISRLVVGARTAFPKMSIQDVDHALQFGQMLGAINCQFDGARGIMYHLDKDEFCQLTKSSIKQGNTTVFSSNVRRKKSNHLKATPFAISSLY